MRQEPTASRPSPSEAAFGRAFSKLAGRARAQRRPDDIPLLADALLAGIAAETGLPAPALTEPSLRAMQQYAWPGNIRELRNVLDRAALLCDGGRIEPRDMRFENPAPPAAPLDGTELSLKELERRHIERVLREEEGKVEPAAQRLGIPRSSLYQKLEVYGIAASRLNASPGSRTSPRYKVTFDCISSAGGF